MNRILNRFLISSGSALIAIAMLTAAAPVRAGDVLFVSDSLTDAANIPAVLSGGGVLGPHPTIAGAMLQQAANPGADHNVTIITNDYMITGGVVFLAEGTNPALAGVAADVTLNDYCSIFWSASGPHEPDTLGDPFGMPPVPGGLGADGGLHNDADVFSSLDGYVTGGGYVFVTGHDAAANPMDPLMEEFIGGTGAVAVQQLRPTPNSAPFGTVSALNNALAVGMVPLGGLTPGAAFAGGVNTLDGVQDLDYVAGLVTAEVTEVVAEPVVLGDAAIWTERISLANGGAAAGADFSKGRIAYVANGVFLFEDLPFNPGVFLSDGEDDSWLNDPVYNGALRNFAFNGCAVAPPPDDPTNLAGRTKQFKVNLTWQGSATADHFNVFRRLDSEIDFQQVGMVTDRIFVETMPAGTLSAEYFVEAENAAGISGESNIVVVAPSIRRRR